MKPNDLKLAQEKLIPAYKVFHGEPTDFSVTEKKIRAYLKATEDSPLNVTLRLNSLVLEFQDEVGWKNICLIFEYVLANERWEDHQAVFAVWSFIGDKFLNSENFSSIEERITLANEFLDVLHRGWETFPNDGFAFYIAKLYYDFPKHKGEERSYFEHSLHWLKTVSEILDKEGEEIPHYVYQYQGLCYEQLGNWDKALQAYNSIDEAVLCDVGGCGHFNPDELKNRIVTCKQYLKN